MRFLAVAVAGVLLLAACGNDDDAEPPAETTTTTSSTTTTTEPDEPIVSTFTGLEIDDEELNERPAIAVKIASDRNAQPQVGLSVADVVLEELVEGGISRFLAVFQSVDSDPVGPMRSARTSEIDLLPLFGQAVFAHSGGNSGTMSAIRSNPQIINAGPDSAYGGLQFRDNSRRRPNNLFTNTSALREAALEQASAPTDWFTFLDADDDAPEGALPVVGVDVSFGSTNTRWVWDADRNEFLRWQDGREHLDPEEQQLGFGTVVILGTTYGTSFADPASPEAITVGGGEAWVVSNGWVVAGTWERPEVGDRITLRDGEGEEIPLAPGRIWISMPRSGAGNVNFLEADPRAE